MPCARLSVLERTVRAPVKKGVAILSPFSILEPGPEFGGCWLVEDSLLLFGLWQRFSQFLGLPCVPPPSSFSFYNFNFILDTSYQTMRIWVCITNSFLQFSISSLASQPLPPSSSSSPLFSVRLLLFFLFLIATKFTEVLRVSNEPPDSPSDF